LSGTRICILDWQLFSYNKAVTQALLIFIDEEIFICELDFNLVFVLLA